MANKKTKRGNALKTGVKRGAIPGAGAKMPFRLSERRGGGTMEMKGSEVGIPGFMDLIEGALLPRGFNVAITGPIGSGKSTVAMAFLYDGLRVDEAAFLLSTDEPGYRIRDNMIDLGMDTTEYEKKELMTFFDAYGGAYAAGEYTMLTPDNPQMLGYLIDKWWQEKRFRRFRWCIDSLTTLSSISDPIQIQRFLWDRVRKAKILNATAFYTITREAHDEKILSNIFNMMDMVIELNISEEKGISKRYLRIAKMRRISANNDWHNFDIVKGKGIDLRVRMYPPAELQK